jgi:hypothetical protein
MKKVKAGFTITAKTKEYVIKGLEGTGISFGDLQKITQVKDRNERIGLRDMMHKILEQKMGRHVDTTIVRRKGEIIMEGGQPKLFKIKNIPLMENEGLKQDISFISDPARAEPTEYPLEGTLKRKYVIRTADNGLQYCVIVMGEVDKSLRFEE